MNVDGYQDGKGKHMYCTSEDIHRMRTVDRKVSIAFAVLAEQTLVRRVPIQRGSRAIDGSRSVALQQIATEDIMPRPLTYLTNSTRVETGEARSRGNTAYR